MCYNSFIIKKKFFNEFPQKTIYGRLQNWSQFFTNLASNAFPCNIFALPHWLWTWSGNLLWSMYIFRKKYDRAIYQCPTYSRTPFFNRACAVKWIYTELYWLWFSWEKQHMGWIQFCSPFSSLFLYILTRFGNAFVWNLFSSSSNP